MTAPSVIGFALVFLVTSVAFSLAFGAALRLGERRLRWAGPRALRRAAAAAVIGPSLVALVVALILVARDGGTWAIQASDRC
ncbi:MAG: hypothetical protein HYY84_07525 [Deltaproteobacteria bacterium]|nr:hypothetical protein [Deltaproteobacteria bacterium]